MSRSYAGLPMAYGDKQQPSTYQTGTFLFRKLAKPLAFIILVSLVFGMYGITGITTLLRKTRSSFQEDHHISDVATSPVVKELCAPQLAALKNCFPSYATKKRARRCKNQYEAVLECRKEV